MKRRPLMLIAAVLALVAGLAGWQYWRAIPVVRFMGFRGEGTRRVATFAVENPSEEWLQHTGTLVARTEQEEVRIPVKWHWRKQEELSKRLSFVSTRALSANPDSNAEFAVALPIVAGNPLAPFRVQVSYVRPAPKFLSFPPFSWLPASTRATQFKTVWSDEVTP